MSGQKRFVKTGWNVVPVLVLGLVISLPAIGQDALKDRVAQLLEQLDSPDEKKAASAGEALVKLGAKIVPLLPVENGKNPARLKSVKEALAAASKQSTGATLVSIKGDSVRLSDALKALGQQSGNTVVDLREQNGQEATNPTIALNLDKVPFFKALDEIAVKSGLSLNFYTAENAIGLLSAGGMPMVGNFEATPQSSSVNPYIRYIDAFRVSLNRIGLTRDYASAADGHQANLQMELVWEPRLRPIMLRLKPDQIKAIDDKGREIKASTSGESMELSIRAENPIVDINLNLAAPERDAKTLEKLEITAELTVPLANQTLVAKNIREANAKAKAGDTEFRIMAFEAEAPVWKVTVELKSGPPAGSEKLDSYRQVSLKPQVSLVKSDGGRIALNGGFSASGGSGPNETVYEFLFVDIPGKPEDHGLAIELPGELKTIPLKWSMEKIPLP
ncbi:MAG: hypothetical protein ACKO5E_23185 [bacterium]